MMRSRVTELKGENPPPKRPAQSVSLGISPLFHVSGLHGTLMMNITTGGKIIYTSGRFEPGKILELIEKERITQFSALGSAGFQIAHHPDLKKIRPFFCVGDWAWGRTSQPCPAGFAKADFSKCSPSCGHGLRHQ